MTSYKLDWRTRKRCVFVTQLRWAEYFLSIIVLKVDKLRYVLPFDLISCLNFSEITTMLMMIRPLLSRNILLSMRYVLYQLIDFLKPMQNYTFSLSCWVEAGSINYMWKRWRSVKCLSIAVYIKRKYRNWELVMVFDCCNFRVVPFCPI